jgi:hypothetical protein
MFRTRTAITRLTRHSSVVRRALIGAVIVLVAARSTRKAREVLSGVALLSSLGVRVSDSDRKLLIEKYGTHIALFATALFFNIFAGIYVAARKLFLKDTGRKLAPQ